MKNIKFTKDKALRAIQDAHYSGERFVFEANGLKAAIVPVEDLEVLEELEISDFETAST